jgi:putative chitobiose transport system permease protein
MNERLVNALIALSVNLAGLLIIYSLMAYELVRLRWHRRGMVAVIITIIATALLCILSDPLSLLIVFIYSIMTGFAIIILSQAATRIPRQLEDSARLDGCGTAGVYWHVILPSVRRELLLIGLLIVMATLFPVCTDVNMSVDLFSSPLPGLINFPRVIVNVFISLLMTLPAIVIFLVARRYLDEPTQGAAV